MLKMSWSDSLAGWAQEWSDACGFAYGQPDEDDIPELGQNLFMTSAETLTVTEPTFAWYSRKSHYHLQTHSCREQYSCEPYKQVVWAESTHVGCGYTQCKDGIMVVCYYQPSGNEVTERPYRYERGEACTQCSNGAGWCRDGFCDDTCEPYDGDCYCNARCKNCGIRDPETCMCHCQPGWYGVDCSIPCTDKHARCGGYQNAWTRDMCEDSEHPEVAHLCPVYCELCEPRAPPPQCDDIKGLSMVIEWNDFRCAQWGDWSTEHCEACGGCGYRIKYRQCDWGMDSITAPCEPSYCVKGVHNPREIFYKRRPSDKTLRRLARNRRCCYDYSGEVPRWIPIPRRCPSVHGWIYED